MIPGFEEIKTAILRLPDTQKREVQKLLNSILQTKESRYESSNLTAATYNLIQREIGGAPPKLRYLQTTIPFEYRKITEVSLAIDSFIHSEFPTATKVTRESLRVLVVHAAKNWLKENYKPVTLRNMLSALAIPDDVFKEQFPGYIEAGALSSTILAHFQPNERTSDVRRKPYP